MKRRESLKALSLSSLGLAVLPTTAMAGDAKTPDDFIPGPGRTDEEVIRDKQLTEEVFFDKSELKTLGILCDIIIPKDEKSGSATDAGVPDFIEFMAKDKPYYQIPLRGGLRWLDNFAVKSFDKPFDKLSEKQRVSLIDQIAYPESAKPEVSQGVSFFNLVRDLTVTGFYTTQIGFNDLEYKGNMPNSWDGVPQHVLDKYGVKYDPLYFQE